MTDHELHRIREAALAHCLMTLVEHQVNPATAVQIIQRARRELDRQDRSRLN